MRFSTPCTWSARASFGPIRKRLILRFASTGTQSSQPIVDEELATYAYEFARTLFRSWIVEGLAGPPSRGERLALIRRRDRACLAVALDGMAGTRKSAYATGVATARQPSHSIMSEGWLLGLDSNQQLPG